MKKKLLSLLLSVTLVLGTMPAALAADDVPFSARSGETELEVVRSGEDYTYTETLYDASWTPVGFETRTAPLYEVTVPAKTGTVTLDFGTEGRLAYGYDKEGRYHAAYGHDGAYEDITAGETTATISGTRPDFVRVQTPYDSSWNSTLLYAVTFRSEGEQQEPDIPGDPKPAVSMEKLMETIAAGYTETSTDWVVMDMAAYAALCPETDCKTTGAAKQAYIDAAIAALQSSGVYDTVCDKAILALTAIGVDAEQLYPAGSSTSISAVEILNGISKSVSAWSAPYTLAAYNQKAYTGTEAYEEELITALLAAQGTDGSWNEYDMPIDTTANAIVGLSFYADRPDVDDAIKKGLNYLSGQMKESGAFDGGYGENANSTAMVIIALAAAGVNPDTDSRFTQNGVSVLDGLLSFAVADGSGFGYADAVSVNSGATEQAFRALIAAAQVMKTGEAYNAYDFSGNTVKAAYATDTAGGDDGDDDSGSHDRPQPSDGITVYFTLKSDSTTWLPRRAVTVDEDATVCDVLTQVLDGEGYTYDDPSDNYIAWVQHPNGDRLAEFDHGPNSGWMYTLNGEHPTRNINEQTLADGDKVVFHYTGNYTQESDYEETTSAADRTAAASVKGLIRQIGAVTAESRDAIQAARSAYDALTGTQKALVTNYQTLLDAEAAWQKLAAPLPFMDVEGHWALSSIDCVYRRGLMQGTSDTVFSPERTVTRGMIAAIVYRLAGQPDVENTGVFTDIAADSYCADAAAWAAETGVMQGYTATTFGPNDAVTRQQLAAVLYRYAARSGLDVSARADLSGFADEGSIGSYAVGAMQWANACQLINGRSDTVLDPGGNATRAQTAVILARFLGLTEQQ